MTNPHESEEYKKAMKQQEEQAAKRQAERNVTHENAVNAYGETVQNAEVTYRVLTVYLPSGETEKLWLDTLNFDDARISLMNYEGVVK